MLKKFLLISLLVIPCSLFANSVQPVEGEYQLVLYKYCGQPAVVFAKTPMGSIVAPYDATKYDNELSRMVVEVLSTKGSTYAEVETNLKCKDS